MTRSTFHVRLLFAIVAVLVSFAFSGCKSPDGFASPIVGVVDAKIDGTMRWNGRYLFVRGAFDGVAGLRSVYGGLLLSEPTKATKTQWMLVDLTDLSVKRGELGQDLIPAVVRSMFAPEELVDIAALFEAAVVSPPAQPPAAGSPGAAVP